MQPLGPRGLQEEVLMADYQLQARGCDLQQQCAGG